MLEYKIKEFAEKNDIIYGICDAERLSHIEEKLKKEDTPFVPKEVERRINPKLIMKDAESIIVIGVSNNRKINFIKDNNLRGKFSIDTVGLDYHIRVRNILIKLANELELNILEKNEVFDSIKNKCKVFVDTGDLTERDLALKAGLGVLGRNCSIISKKFGSMFNIGYIITDVKLKYSKGNDFFKVGCYDCKKCVKMCPGKALSNDTVQLDYKRCVSYNTQNKNELSKEEIENMGTFIYGCDICQAVCPHNRNIESIEINDIDEVYPKLEYLLTLTKKEFTEKYKKTSSGWRGKKLFKRNALIALYNIKTEEAINIIKAYSKNDKDEDIKKLAKRLLDYIKEE